MIKKHRLRPNTIILWLKILAILLLLFFPIHTLATEFNITISGALGNCAIGGII